MSDPIARLLENALALHGAGKLPQAEAIYRQILAADPKHCDALHLLGVIAHQVGQDDSACKLIRQAIVVQPRFPDYYKNLGKILLAQDRLDEAVVCFQQLIRLQPNVADHHNDLGNAFSKQRNRKAAIECYQSAIALEPSNAIYYNNLGNALKELDQFKEAIDPLRRAIALDPTLPDPHYHLGNCLESLDEYEQACESIQTALALKPDFLPAHNSMSNLLRGAGRLPESIDCIRRALAFEPGNSWYHKRLILLLNCHQDIEPADLAAESRRWADLHAAPLSCKIARHPNYRSPDRRLRIGYVSADFRNHACAFYLYPLLQNHDPSQVEVFCYSNVVRPDHFTKKFQALPHKWRQITTTSDEHAATLIRTDAIDILVDLSLYTEPDRLLLFARKPAPVQVTWLGYPGTTGLTAIDYRLTDPYLDPPDADTSVYSEKSIRLPDTFWCYDSLSDSSAVSSLPALQAGHITFGCLNDPAKLSDRALQLFARVLAAVPSSRLLLRVDNASARVRASQVIAAQGPLMDRVDFVKSRPRDEYLTRYHKIDIVLDPIPYNGHTTSLDALWQGVPVVTLVGKTLVGRAGFSQLSNLGMPELIARTPEQYIQVATQLANDLRRLTELRRTLRQRMESSPLMDAPRFARNIEAAYRQMWQTWCATGK